MKRHGKRIISLFLAVMIMGSLFSGCGKIPHDTPYTFRVANDPTGERQWMVRSVNARDVVSYVIRQAQDDQTDVVFTGLKKGKGDVILYLARAGEGERTADNVYRLTLQVDARKNVTQQDPPYGAYSVRLAGDVSGSEWSVDCDEKIVHVKANREYPKKSSGEDGMQEFTQIYTFTGRRPGAAHVRINVDYPWAEGAGTTREDFWLLVDADFCVSRLEPTDFVSFRVVEHGMRAMEDVYEAERTENGVRLTHYYAVSRWSEETNRYEDERMDETVIDGGETLYMYLAGMMHACNVPGWDGFRGKNPPGVLDGTMFSFEAKLADGSNVTASGSNNFPKRYSTFWDSLYSVVSIAGTQTE